MKRAQDGRRDRCMIQAGLVDGGAVARPYGRARSERYLSRTNNPERDATQYRHSCRDSRRQLCHHAFLRARYVCAVRLVCDAEREAADELPRVWAGAEELNPESLMRHCPNVAAAATLGWRSEPLCGRKSPAPLRSIKSVRFVSSHQDPIHDRYGDHNKGKYVNRSRRMEDEKAEYVEEQKYDRDYPAHS